MDPRPYIDVLNIPDLYKLFLICINQWLPKWAVERSRWEVRQKGENGKGGEGRVIGSDRVALGAVKNIFFLPNLNDKICHKH